MSYSPVAAFFSIADCIANEPPMPSILPKLIPDLVLVVVDVFFILKSIPSPKLVPETFLSILNKTAGELIPIPTLPSALTTILYPAFREPNNAAYVLESFVEAFASNPVEESEAALEEKNPLVAVTVLEKSPVLASNPPLAPSLYPLPRTAILNELSTYPCKTTPAPSAEMLFTRDVTLLEKVAVPVPLLTQKYSTEPALFETDRRG